MSDTPVQLTLAELRKLLGESSTIGCIKRHLAFINEIPYSYVRTMKIIYELLKKPDHSWVEMSSELEKLFFSQTIKLGSQMSREQAFADSELLLNALTLARSYHERMKEAPEEAEKPKTIRRPAKKKTTASGTELLKC